MRRMVGSAIAIGLILSACGTPAAEVTPSSPPTSPPKPTNTPPPTATISVLETEEVQGIAREGNPLPNHVGEYFSSAGSCTLCHTNMTDSAGEDVSIDQYWRSTMMANASRDPYWLASVRREVETFPELSEVIQDKCANCHMPMAQFTAATMGDAGVIFGENGLLSPDTYLHLLAMDGVSCTLCHQIRADGLGTANSFSGGFSIDTTLQRPERLIFGPYTASRPDSNAMQATSGYIPEQGLHLSTAEICATCHTLYTPYIDAAGEIAGEFPEQMVYFEWYYSDYRGYRSCQDCHMPEADGGVRISTTSQKLRSPFAKHTFVGGNAYMLSILDQFGDELGVTASSDHFVATIERTLDQLTNDTVTLTVEDARLSGGRVILDLTIENLVGHKFPSGFPARRAWLHVKVVDASGGIVFESGAVNPDGSIIGNDNDADPTQYERHFQAIVQGDQVQIYEAILRDSELNVTTTLLRAAGYLKDNRLLPAGFDKSAPIEEIRVRGFAWDDINFDEAFDQIQYVMATGSSQGPYTVTVELLYQSIGYRWIENLRGQQGSEIGQFLGYVDAMPNQPVVIDLVELQVGG